MKSRGEIITTYVIGVLLALTLIALYAPVIIVVLGAFYLDGHGNFNFAEPTTKYFISLSANTQLMTSIWNTIIVGCGAVLLSTVVATAIAIYVHLKPGRGATVLQFLVFLTFLLPPLIVGLSLAIFVREIGLPTGINAVIIGHEVCGFFEK